MENNIEEDIKIIEDFILKTDVDYSEYNEQIVGDISYQAIQHLLSAYQEILKENEELKEERQIVGIPVRNKRDGRIGIVLHQWESGSVAVLESINPRVINTHDSWNTLEIVTDEVKQTQIKCETIPIQKIKDKIEEVKEFSENAISSVGLQLTIEVLQELLEGRKI